MTTIRKHIQEWRDALLTPNQNDVLANITDKNAVDIHSEYQSEKKFALSPSPLLQRVLKQHRQFLKETGAPIFGIGRGKIAFQIQERQYEMPFLLADATIVKNRLNDTFEIEQKEDFYVNPLLLQVTGIDELPQDFNEAQELLQSKGLENTITEGIWAANFHPHRFILQKELSDVAKQEQLPNSIKELFGEAVEQQNECLLSDYWLFPADESQKEAIETAKKNQLVIQGPPGTGKSQVIANLIGKSMGSEQQNLIVTEKSVALQVIYDLMKERELHHFCLLYHHQLKAKNVVRSIQETWKYIENYSIQKNTLNKQASLAQNGLDLTLNRLRQTDLIGGISFGQFKAKQKEIQAKNKESTYLTVKPTLPIWEKEKVVLTQLEKRQFPIFKQWLILKDIPNDLNVLDQQLKKIVQLLQQLPDPTIDITTLSRQRRLSSHVSLFFYNDKPLPLTVLKTNSRKQKQFLKHYQQIQGELEKEDLLKAEEKHWKKQFSISELHEYITALSSTNRFNIRSWRTRNKLVKFTDLNLVDGQDALQNLVELQETRRTISQLKEQFRSLQLPDDLEALHYVYHVIQRLQSVSENEYKTIFEWSPEKRVQFLHNASVYSELSNVIKTVLSVNEEESILHQITAVQKEFSQLAENSSLLQQISQETKSVLRHTDSLAEAEQAIFNSHWKDFNGRFPVLAQLSGETLNAKADEIFSLSQQENKAFATQITHQIKTQFESYNELLRTPAHKLSDTKKKHKKALRKGKSILVKAFDKQRVFPSTRELLESDAVHWIKLLKPVLLCSPYSVAKSLPIDLQVDLVVFDEASQIPLSHAIGSVYRGRRIVVSGDQQQMAPQFYFQRTENHQGDVLHHVSYNWKNAHLTHHYRSRYPELIAFSNRYFYENRLKTFASPHASKAIHLVDACGTYSNRVNEKEAEIAATLIREKIKKKELDFGLVAFSQAQLDTILSKLSGEILQQIEQSKDIFCQALENVQGDQCEHLIISLGYAKNEEGQFHLRFGPLNQEQGHRRLNVLMSRAKGNITFIRSVNSADFPISTNEGVEMLRKLQLFLEEQSQDEERRDEVDSNKENHTLTIDQPAERFNSAQELVDFYRTMKTRGWSIKFQI